MAHLSNTIAMHPLPLAHIVSDDHERRSSMQTALPFQQSHSTAIEPSRPSAEDIHRTASGVVNSSDLEQQSEQFTTATDPFSLSTKLKTPTEITTIRRSISQKKTIGPVATDKETARALAVQGFYEAQNENIERLLKPVSEHRRLAKEESDADSTQFKIAVNGSFAANIILAVLQIYGAVSSASLSLFTTMADAIFDPLSNVTLILSHRAVNRVDSRKFPSGKARIENAGNIVFCFLMSSVSFILIVLSARDLAAGSEAETLKFHLPSVIAVGIAFTTKLGLFLYCWALRNKYSQIRILWEDHRNDLLINGFGLMTSVLGSKAKWWIDPMGAIIISCLIATLWLRTAYHEFQLLIGVSADTHMLQLITYISMTHSPNILALDTVRAWHSGPRLIVEVDIVMDAEDTLRATHDIADELQTKLESLPDVERAYVHVDYETSHAPEHFLKKEL